MAELIGIVLYIIFLILCIELFLILLAGSLAVGGIGGLFIGIFRGFANYFSALFGNLRLRK